MRGRCVSNKGRSLVETSIASGYTVTAVFPLSVDSAYRIYGMAVWRDAILVLVADDNNLPSWIPIELFEVTDRQLEDGWLFESYNEADGLRLLCGYAALIQDDGHYDALLEREPIALEIFYKLTNS